ncbi:MAG TPA: DUF2064 domain-containing protein [candidate division Zixibacteria bacterium]|nr:DUF2064 domain-containing protein [candidate division Zixibacteria bacterium]MDD4916920.1 DUF2064 domain-containing protein [candidate division Zixibacteria bacterium]MDM7973081.1 DUF2064 domain-containing protein [candidate division Zixibacteria bacterium]HOD67764.1 DUF2064 domain-containing protein [candidate division Zixibacteria bacterium]HOZ08241.1 DUF2064 domain-containing protein [candidate division Zixibacteria bacterium]
MARTKKNDSVIAVCVQEPTEDGSQMELGAIQGDSLRFLHQAFITDTINHALDADVDVRLYYAELPERERLVGIITEYLRKKSSGKRATALKNRFQGVKLPMERWGLRIEKVFQDAFAAGYRHVLVIGSRTPTVKTDQMCRALRMLRESDAVFGPTPEGRYYVIGMSSEYRVKLSEFDWKSPSIYHDVSNAFTEQELRWAELEIWYCVEDPDELELMVRDINQFRFEGDELSARETELVIERLLSRME